MSDEETAIRYEYPYLGEHKEDQEKKIARLQAVVDAAREVAKRWDIRGLGKPLPGEHPTDADCLNAMSDAIRALDGAPTGDSVPRSDTDRQMYRSTVHQPSDSGTDNVTPPADLLRGSDADGE